MTIPDTTISMKRDDLAVLSQIVFEIDEARKRAEKALISMQTRLAEAVEVLNELRAQLP